MLSPTLLNDSKYSGGLLKAVMAASWKGAGAESVILTWMFLIAEAMTAGAIAHPTLQPESNIHRVWQSDSEQQQASAITWHQLFKARGGVLYILLRTHSLT